LLVVLTDLNHEVRKYLSYAMLSIENYRLDIKADRFKTPSGFFIHSLVFGSNFLPVQVLF
jgi:hypothetical protein